jgi:hypothetical protein
MSNNQHTPGPWFYEGQNIRNGDGLDVATVDSERSTERCTSDRIPLKEWTANTRLIAAAPDLLDALEEAIEVVGSWGDDGDPSWLERAKSAIAKVGGAE